MTKGFNFTGTCVPEKHYMVDISSKIDAIIALIKEDVYFTITRPRQYGKTTTLSLLAKKLRELGYIAIKISFEGLGQKAFSREDHFAHSFVRLIKKQFDLYHIGRGIDCIETFPVLSGFEDLSDLITHLITTLDKEVVLLIDEVDRSSNNDLFLYFLGMLRNKYLARNEGEDQTFKSVILAGVHDVKSLKMKIRENGEAKYNSPWNIAQNLPVDLHFSSLEIETMLTEYSTEKNITMDIPGIAHRLYHFTSGYPFLVSRLCFLVDSHFLEQKEWHVDDIDHAVDLILREDNTNFESLIKNLENNKELYTLVEKILLEDAYIIYNEHNKVIKQGMICGIFKKEKYLEIHNLIYKELIYNYMALNLKIKSLLHKNLENYNFNNHFLLPDKTLDFEKILLRFQAFMKEQYSDKDKLFIERNWRLLFLAFIKPVINGHGFDFKEVQISEEKRLDVVITFYNKKYITELKIWRGPAKHSRGLNQLADYLERQNKDRGYLIIFDMNKEMNYKTEKKTIRGCDIYCAWV